MPIIYNENYNRDIRYNKENTHRWMSDDLIEKGKFNQSQRGISFINDYCIINYAGGELELLGFLVPFCVLAGVIMLFFGAAFIFYYEWTDFILLVTSLFLIFVPYRYQSTLILHPKRYVVFDWRNRIVHCPHRFKKGYERISYGDAFLLCLEKEQLPHFTPMHHFFILRPGYLINRKKT